MKRSLVLLVTLALLTTACATSFAPTTTGVVTNVENGKLTVANANGDGTSTYAIDYKTQVYSPDGSSSQRAYLTKGQRVMVWANGDKAVRINIES